MYDCMEESKIENTKHPKIQTSLSACQRACHFVTSFFLNQLLYEFLFIYLFKIFILLFFKLNFSLFSLNILHRQSHLTLINLYIDMLHMHNTNAIKNLLYSNFQMNSKSTFYLPLLFLLHLLLKSTFAQLHVEHYRKSCPNVESIVHAAVRQKFEQTFVTAPATLRLFFHDCFVQVTLIFHT